MTPTNAPLPRPLLFGIFFISMGMLLQEIILTRIFSVTMFYHFAFMVVSITLFGIGVSGIWVFLNPKRFAREVAPKQMAHSALLFAIAVPLCFILQRNLPAAADSPRWGLLYLAATYVLIAVPFFLGGTAISLALTHWSGGVSTLYFADLVGASIGCALVFPGLTFLTGPDIVVLVGLIGALSAVSLAQMAGPAERRWSWLTVAAMAALLVVNTTTPFKPVNVGSRAIQRPDNGEWVEPLAAKWNPMARVLAFNLSNRPVFRPGQSPDSTFFPEDQILFQLDRSAMTWAVPFDGDWSKVDWIYTDVSVLPLFLKPGGKLLDIGSGGGQNALAAIGLGSKDITCVEINPTVVEWTKTKFDAITGNIYTRPEVRVVVGDGRTVTARSTETYDVIAFVSSTTFTATTSGAFMMAENNLFTREAFQEYWDHLTPGGMMMASQVMTSDYPGLMLRMTGLARATLEANGVTDAARHIIVITKQNEGYGAMVMKKSPFTDAELDILDAKSREMGWRVLHSPRVSQHPQFHDVITVPDFEAWVSAQPLNLYPPTDDKPFFFNLVPFSRLNQTRAGNYDIKYGKVPAQILLNLFFIVTVLTVLFILVPLFLARRARFEQKPGTLPTLLFFTMIGLGFIMIEVPLMQRFVLYLGHPIYAITTILFSILLFSGVGSYLTRFMEPGTSLGWLKRSIPALLVLTLVYNLGLEKVFALTQNQSQAAKVALSMLLLLPLGLLMGMPFPAMMRRVSAWSPGTIPWCWGVNGATSVLGSVTGVIVALASGFTASLWVGMAAYVGAFLCTLAIRDDGPPKSA
jgi:spermidine synthase